jgi:hypothetical protein
MGACPRSRDQHNTNTRLTWGVGWSIRTWVIGYRAWGGHQQTTNRDFGLQDLRRLRIGVKGKVQRQAGITIWTRQCRRRGQSKGQGQETGM